MADTKEEYIRLFHMCVHVCFCSCIHMLYVLVYVHDMEARGQLQVLFLRATIYLDRRLMFPECFIVVGFFIWILRNQTQILLFV